MFLVNQVTYNYDHDMYKTLKGYPTRTYDYISDIWPPTLADLVERKKPRLQRHLAEVV